ncbi:MAG: 5'-3' exonuclease H3TH domain-containing protein [Gammaproteobacteria bacterium]|nr:MAG: 5'-3' exonuclease H3TH domain-containing protein [Gammaproteobacteria bacterium]
MARKTPLYLVDASIYIFRAYFSLPAAITDARGQPNNAVFGYASFLAQLMEKTGGEYFAFAFDEGLSQGFRTKLYPEYKANRTPPDPDLKRQLQACRRLTKTLGFACYGSRAYEADDLIGSIARKVRNKDFHLFYLTNDKDYAQLMRPGDTLWNYAKDEILRHKDIEPRYGVKPGQIIDWLALAGDSIDNIPGVPGIGNKTAMDLLQRYRSLKRLYEKLHTLPDSGIRGARRLHGLLLEHKEQAHLSWQLARIEDKAPVKCAVNTLKKKRPRKEALHKLCDELKFGEGLRERLMQH